MSMTILSTKGQLILPKAVRDDLQWGPGTRLTVQQTADGVLLAPLQTAFAPSRADAAPKTVADMQACSTRCVAVTPADMRAIDTNIVVRFLVDDDPEQSRRARAIIGREPVFVPRCAVLPACPT